MESKMSKEISKEAARRFLVIRQGFLQKKGKNGTLEPIRQLECIQIDPIRVIHPNQHLVLCPLKLVICGMRALLFYGFCLTV